MQRRMRWRGENQATETPEQQQLILPESLPWLSEDTVTSLSWPYPALTKALTKVEARFWRALSRAAPCGCRPSARETQQQNQYSHSAELFNACNGSV